eukprot:c9717_g1_i1.p1 GENE.c9717_g1_i1~~c9717_g1_i1.p1  ORF type:complete len:123 (-),score=33.45 c9717_g1_i1:30-398(-)
MVRRHEVTEIRQQEQNVEHAEQPQPSGQQEPQGEEIQSTSQGQQSNGAAMLQLDPNTKEQQTSLEDPRQPTQETQELQQPQRPQQQAVQPQKKPLQWCEWDDQFEQMWNSNPLVKSFWQQNH